MGIWVDELVNKDYVPQQIGGIPYGANVKSIYLRNRPSTLSEVAPLIFNVNFKNYYRFFTIGSSISIKDNSTFYENFSIRGIIVSYLLKGIAIADNLSYPSPTTIPKANIDIAFGDSEGMVKVSRDGSCSINKRKPLGAIQYTLVIPEGDISKYSNFQIVYTK